MPVGFRISLAMAVVVVLAAGLSVGIGQQGPVASDPGHPVPSPTPTIGEALDRRVSFPFSEPAPLRDVTLFLQETMKGPVVLDTAALERQGVTPESTVQLAVDGIRLKTGLKLLLGPLHLTWRVVPEDNLLIVTDREGTEEPTDRMMVEIQELHRDIHDLQDAVDELRRMLSGPVETGPRVRGPSIIDEVPIGPDGKPDNPGSGPAEPLRVRPG
jgi:hypothetical protein